MYDITNPNAAYDWLCETLQIKKNRFIENYIIECNNNFDIFYKDRQ